MSRPSRASRSAWVRSRNAAICRSSSWSRSSRRCAAGASVARSRRGASGGYTLARGRRHHRPRRRRRARRRPVAGRVHTGALRPGRPLRRVFRLDRGAAGARGRPDRDHHRRPAAARGRAARLGADVPHLTGDSMKRAGSITELIGRRRWSGSTASRTRPASRCRQARVVQPRRQRQGPHRRWR